MDRTNSNLPSATTDLDEKYNNGISDKPSVKSYATRVFQESTVGILSSIFTTHSKYRRFFKVFLSLLCIAGFIYHCVTFLNHVFEYPEVVDISIDRSRNYNWPAYTYCSNNPPVGLAVVSFGGGGDSPPDHIAYAKFGWVIKINIRRRVFCDAYPQYCVVPSEEFCKKFSSYCGANFTLVPSRKYYYYLPYDFSADFVLIYGIVPNVLNMKDSFIRINRGGKKDDEISGPYLRTFASRNCVMSCYRIHSLVESNKQPLQKTREKGREIPLPDEVIRFHVNDEAEMMNPISEPGVYFSVHSPFEDVNPLEKGILLKGGRTYKVLVERQEEHLLKAPFESNCMDYEELWERNNRTGPRTKKMCEEKCYLDKFILTYECAPHDVLYPHNMMICSEKFLSDFANARPLLEDKSEFYSKCRKNCRDECRSSKFTTEYAIVDYVDYVEPEEQHQHIKVEIYLSNDEVKVQRHSPKYETVDVISAIGGFMGCWLGIALMDILDIFGSIITVCKYAFRKGLNKEN